MKRIFLEHYKKPIKSALLLSLFFLGNLTYATMATNQKNKSIRDVYVSLNLRTENIETIIKSVEAKTDFIFVYDKKDLENDVVLEIPKKPIPVLNVLETISNSTSLRFLQRNNNIIVRLEKTEVSPEPVVEKTITGVLTDENGQLLPGGTVQAKGAKIGVVSDFDGNYSITVPDNVDTLIFSYVGYVTQEILISDKSVINFQFTLDTSVLDEVVVIGYGTQKKSDITGSVGSVESYRLEDVPNNNFTQALQGSVSGVYIKNNTASAEQADVEIRIRGQNSITANNQPLIVLDGAPFGGGISQINPDDIASIEVLKDVSSSAIYGTRGANGVILITTKKGTIGKPTVTYSTYVGFQNPINVPNLMNGREFADFKLTRNGSPDDPADALSDTELNNLNAGRDTDWVDLTTRNAVRSQHAISISSGSENTNIYFSGTFLDVKGIARGDNFSRYNLQLNVTQKVNDWFSLGSNTRIGYSDRAGVRVSLGQAFRMNPLTDPLDEEGNITIYPWPEDEFFGNPLANTLYDNEDDEYTIFSNIFADFDLGFIPGLSFRLNSNFEYTGRTVNTYRGRNTKLGFEADGILLNRQQKSRNYLLENILMYKKSIGKHDFDLTALYSTQTEDFQRFDYTGRGFANDILTYYQAAGTTDISPTNQFRESTLLSQMGRLQYGYDNKYRVTLTARRDGFSGFGANNKYAFFPSVGAAWTISQENFLKNSSILNNLKLRLSHGKIGNQAIDPFQTLSGFATQNYLGGNNGSSLAPGYFPRTLGDPSLGWETTVSSNIGLDFGFFKNRLRGSVEYYISNTEDLLLNRRISLVQGIPTILQNVGAVENNGFELLLSGDIIAKKDFRWSTDFNFSFNRNEITELAGDGVDDVANRRFIGQPIDVNFGLAFDGIWQENELDEAAVYGAVPGDVKILDLNPEDGDGITEDDRIIQGSLQPDFIAGLGSTFTYKDFSLNLFFYTEQGIERPNRLLDSDDPAFLVDRNNGINRTFWTPENPINTYPSNSRTSNPRGVLFYEDASFIRLRDITLSYNLPKKVLTTVGLKDFRVYTTVRNLLTITDWSGTDPEFGTNPGEALQDQFGVPLERSIVLGFNLSL